MRIRATTRLIAVVGDPVAHSLSPVMHNAAIAALGLDAVYVGLRASAATFPDLARSLLAAGGALNVTIPFKRAAADLLEHPSELVQRTGACNTLWTDGAVLAGDNTDVPAVAAEARALLAGRPVRRALVLGTGASARGAVVAISTSWPGAEIAVQSREGERAGAFTAWAKQQGVGCSVWGGEGSGQVDLVVNATPLGLKADDPLPLAQTALASLGAMALLDLVYARGGTRLVAAARAAGLGAADGRGVLVAQGGLAFEHFFATRAPLEVMRAAVEDVLRA
jgi:shikimate dehydrogenase